MWQSSEYLKLDRQLGDTVSRRQLLSLVCVPITRTWNAFWSTTCVVEIWKWIKRFYEIVLWFLDKMTTKYFWTCAAQDRSATFHNISMIIPCQTTAVYSLPGCPYRSVRTVKKSKYINAYGPGHEGVKYTGRPFWVEFVILHYFSRTSQYNSTMTLFVSYHQKVFEIRTYWPQSSHRVAQINPLKPTVAIWVQL